MPKVETEQDVEQSDSGSPPSSDTPSTTITLEERLQQLQHTLSQLTTERDTLASSLKSARRDAQKGDAALRAEIDGLKRASERNVAAEHRARQKVLALQEAVKRAQVATRETDALVRQAENALPNLRKERDEKERVYAEVKEEEARARRGREAETDKDRRRMEGLKNELSGLGNRMEKLSGKRDKLESGVIPDLEEQLRELEREVERAEMEAEQRDGIYTLLQRRRPSHPGPIQRPTRSTLSSRAPPFEPGRGVLQGSRTWRAEG